MWTSVEGWSYYYSNTTMNWTDARVWCKAHYTDMVAIQNKEEIDHLNSWLPTKSTYYWIGIRKINNVWTWVGTNKSLTVEATNWAHGEPNNGKGRKRIGVNEDCVEMYIKRTLETGKWNDERCGKKKTALCYTVSITLMLLIIIIIEKLVCDSLKKKKPSFDLLRSSLCFIAVQCPALQELENGSASCKGEKAIWFNYGNTCSFSCAPGYRLVGPSAVTCTSAAEWNETTPPITCQNPEGEAHLVRDCNQPLADLRPDSICRFRCEAGFELQGTDTIQCSEEGQWSKAIPTCKVIECPSPEIPSSVQMNCSLSPSSFDSPMTPHPLGMICIFSCDDGHELQGTSRMECVNPGQWTSTPPSCTGINILPTVLAPENGHIDCLNNEQTYNSQCSFTCNQDYSLNGHELLTCDHHGNWTGQKPTCQAIACEPLLDPEQGSHYCFHPFGSNRFNTSCHFRCELGFQLVGTPQLRCQASGHWNHPVPLCQVEQCPALNHANISAGRMNCSHPIDPLGEHSYGSICTVQCEEGFDPIGTNMTTCSSQGNWISSRCPLSFKCPALNPPSHGSLVCSNPHEDFGSQCTTTCEEGFVLNGTASTDCSSQGMWSADMPLCLAKRCPALNPPSHGSLVCSNPHKEFSFGSQCTTTCEEGFVLNGTASTDCSSQGMWSADMPLCLAKRCPALNPPSHGSLVCSNPHKEFSFGSQCTTTCEEGFVLNGTASTDCSSQGMWSADMPLCLSVGTAMLMYTGIGASSAVVPLVLIGLGLLITTCFKKRGEANRDVTGRYRHVCCSSSSQCVNDAYL
uniref:Uncharacterized protein n=1 Tax=Mola mola TaxID=94237 RepID=A0A3Q3XEL8_MOLML